MTASTSIKASIVLSNDGDYDGYEIVQLYIRDKVGSITRPVKELKGFQKVFLKKGERKDISFTITIDDLKFYNAEKQYIAEPGAFEIAIAPNSDFRFEHILTLHD